MSTRFSKLGVHGGRERTTVLRGSIAASLMAATFHVHTFGCQMNVHDSDRMAELLARARLARVDLRRAQTSIVLNTCSVREKAEQKLRSEVGRLAALKKTKRDLMLVVAGCVAQQEGDKLLAREPALDLVIGPDNIASSPRSSSTRARARPPRAHRSSTSTRRGFSPRAPSSGGRPSARS